MQTTKRLEPIVESLRSSADVDCVFGKPFEAHGKLYVPVASVRYGFGGGGGSEDEVGAGETGKRGTKTGHGGGMGGGMKAKAVGVVEITPMGAKFIRFEPSWRQLIATGVGLWVGVRLLSGLLRR